MFIENEVKVKWHMSKLLKKIDGLLQVSLSTPASSAFQLCLQATSTIAFLPNLVN